MANADKHINPNELLRRYLSGDIDAHGEAALFRAAREDEALAEALAGYQQLPEADHLATIERLKERLPANKTRKLLTPRTISIAASLLLLLFVGVYGYQSSNDFATAAEKAAPLAENKPLETDEEHVSESAATEATDMTVGTSEPDLVAPETGVWASGGEPVKPTASAREKEAPIAVPAAPVENNAIAQGDVEKQTGAASPSAMALPEPSMPLEDADMLEEISLDPAALTNEADKMVATTQAARARSLPQGVRLISGYVTDANDRPIIAAKVVLPGQPIGETTDSSGYFEFLADQTVSRISVSHPGFETDEVLLPRGESDLLINLNAPVGISAEEQEEDWLLSGSRTTIYPNEEKTSASVRGGIRQLRKDMQAAKPAHLPNGIVKVSFSVQPDGSLTNFQFGRKSEQALVDFVRNYLQQSSQWELRGGTSPTRMAFTFRFQ